MTDFTKISYYVTYYLTFTLPPVLSIYHLLMPTVHVAGYASDGMYMNTVLMKYVE